jgi:acetyl-CoA decarbonylase/synthase complex subunit gamma
MAMTGLQIFKLLPNKNCGECGVPTCLAFAMKLAAKTAEPGACPYISESSLRILGASQAPPVKKISFKLEEKTLDLGAETVLYRHEKTFVNKPLICLELPGDLSDAEFAARLSRARSFSFERVGEVLEPEGFSLTWNPKDPEGFLRKLAMVTDKNRIVILPELPPELLEKVVSAEQNPSRLAARVAAAEDMGRIAAALAGKPVKLVISADDEENLFQAVAKAETADLKDLILHLRARSAADILKNSVLLRRLAISKSFKPAGCPLFIECGDELLSAAAGICKYASIIVLQKYGAETLFPLLTLRQNIYTDPQKPLQIQSGIYRIGEPGAEAPLLVTTNFSLTYFIVSGEVDNSPYAARLLVTDSEGMSVLTAWSANKFSASLIAKALRGSGVEKDIRHRKLIIPGYVAVLKGELEEALAGWEILVGPQEAADIPSFLKEVWGG